MMLSMTVLVNMGLLMCVSYAASLDTNQSELIVELGPQRLYSFKGIGDQEVLHWPVFPSTTKFILRFSGTVNQTGEGVSVRCPEVNVSALVRQQAIPLPNPRGAVTPVNTFIHNDGVVYSGNFTVSTFAQGQYHDVEVLMNSSENGHYFAALFLPYDLEHIEVSGLAKECLYYVTLKVYAFRAANLSSFVSVDQNKNASKVTKLTRKQAYAFAVSYMPLNNNFNLTTKNTKRLSWEVYPVTDSGGTLEIKFKTSTIKLNSKMLALTNATVYGCLKNEFSSNGLNCTGDLLKLNDSHVGKDMLWNVPFPVAGTWTLDLWFECTSPDDRCNDVIQPVDVSVGIGTCVENCQNNLKHGDCGLYRTVDVLFMSCRCRVGWMGLACNDGRFALSYYTQLLHTLLLTISNVMFIPCVILAIYRKYYTEALVYLFVAFMSTCYHACDQPGSVAYCLLPYNTLQFCDFLSSISAIWFTLIAVADLATPLESWLQVFGCLGVSVAVTYKRFNLWTTTVPALVGIGIVLLKWGMKCYETKHCFPGRKTTLLSIVPGLLCAGVGLILYAFVETSENYYIVHSIWHVLIAYAVLFLLPVQPKRNVKKSYQLVNNSANNSAVSLFSSRNCLNAVGLTRRRNSNSSSDL